MIEGVRTKEIIKRIDERGYFAELLRLDWKDLLGGENEIVQTNLSWSHPSIVRAWHRHLRGQVDYFLCLAGSVKVCAFDDRDDSQTYGELDETILSSHRLLVARIPGDLWHGYTALGSRPAALIYFVNRLYDYQQPDEERRPWNDPGIMPSSVNGRRDDPRAGKPWDWHYPPHR